MYVFKRKINEIYIDIYIYIILERNILDIYINYILI